MIFFFLPRFVCADTCSCNGKLLKCHEARVLPLVSVYAWAAHLDILLAHKWNTKHFKMKILATNLRYPNYMNFSLGLVFLSCL